MNICYIACALDCQLDFIKNQGDLVIGADRGYLNLKKHGITTDIVIGDFDSYNGDIDCNNVKRLPRIKDFTDGEVAILHGIEKGYKKIVVYGAIGGALDHTIANIAHCAKYTKDGINISFVDGENALFCISNSRVCFSSKAKGRISVFAYGEKAEGVYEKGLFYTLDNATLDPFIPLGVSNEFIGKDSEISVKNGALLIYTSKENFENHLTKR
ncbi:MAG: thiamine diphosphokinase [Clostridia bacterium]|nr:thiamine diphosphokinase [Clostridia bacterium]